MATKSLRFCRHAGCRELVTDTYCPVHAAEHDAQKAEGVKRYDRWRGTPAERGYDGDWQRASKAYLRLHPLCERCLEMGKVEPATMVHHKRALKDGGARLDPNNFMALSNNCHEIVEGRKIDK
jgi:5-methylcytosine-specific restriction protein A